VFGSALVHKNCLKLKNVKTIEKCFSCVKYHYLYGIKFNKKESVDRDILMGLFVAKCTIKKPEIEIGEADFIEFIEYSNRMFKNKKFSESVSSYLITKS
jgi:hypothetical protein